MDIYALGSLTLVNSADYLKSGKNVSDALALSFTPSSGTDLLVISSLDSNGSTNNSASVSLNGLVYNSEVAVSGINGLDLSDSGSQEEQVQKLINLFA